MQTLRRLAWLLIITVMIITLLMITAIGSLKLARNQLTAGAVQLGARQGSAALLKVSGPGVSRTWSSGVARPGATSPVTGAERFRIGSVTKTFVATVVLQLVDQSRVGLDEPIERYLPGLVPNGKIITVRQLLNHTSGLYDYMKRYDLSTNRWRGPERYLHYTPRQLLRVAFDHPPYFAPGADFRYSNTNYVVLGLLIEHLTGRPYASEIRRRILQPLQLSGTSLPGDDPRIPEPAVRAVGSGGDGRTVDVTEQNESLDWAAGEMISTLADLDTFLDALLAGRLISSSALHQMQRTVPMGLGFSYGLGLERFDLPCGGHLWGHGGQLLGYVSYAYRRDDGRSMTMLVASGSDDAFAVFLALATATFCAT
ncbi:serine hydrolase domain-containing protein [Microlunatus soli]|uniref:serine hydrolase domain-containing protein n=1 Tax=Microlunatus soli TaxID=630515 RepID=UPI0018D3D077|nr:serine hydrolase domain-containing protein [Microlunatus soli]